MHKEVYISIAIEIIAICLGIWQAITGTISPEIGWPIVIIVGAGGIALLIYGIRKKDITLAEESETLSPIWEHYKKLTDLILGIETAPHKQWTEIIADMQRELTDIGDTELDEIMSTYFELLDHEEELGLKPARFNSKIILERIRKHMNKKYPRR